MTSENMDPIFIHSLFRSGSTYFYHAVKRTGRFHIYHEPFHEIIGSLPTNWDNLADRTKQLKSHLRHDFLVEGYFDEYLHLLIDIEGNFKPDVSYELFFLNKNEDSPILKSYIDCLIGGSPKKPVFQCTRTTGRIPWLKQNYISKNIFLLRNPWDQWFSYKVDSYVASTPQLIYSQPRLPKVLEDVMEFCNFESLKGDSLTEKLNYCLSHPITPDADYSLFFGFWLFSLLAADQECDMILDMDQISREKSKKIQAESKLAEAGLDNIDLSDCNLHRAIFKTSESGFYQKVEDQVFDVFRKDVQYENQLSMVEEYLSLERRNSFIDTIGMTSTAKNVLEDAARLRISLRSTEQALSQSTNRLNQENQALTTQLNEKKQEVDTISQKYQEILNSKVWKIGLFFRKIRVRLVPPNSYRARILRWLIEVGFARIQERRGSKKFRMELELVKSSGLFDKTWYLKNNPDVAQTKVDPLHHYLQNGGFEGRDPGSKFSSKWYIKNYSDVRNTKINPLVHYLKYGVKEGRSPLPELSTIKLTSGVKEKMSEAVISIPNQLTVFTICSRNFTAYARTLFESVHQHHPNAEMFMFLCDEIDSEYSESELPFKIVPLSDLGIPNVDEMAQRYNITEFNTAIKPYAFSYLFKKLGKEQIIYMDPDILVLSPLQEVVDEFAKGAECVLTPHILEPAENVEMSDIKMLQFGIYNLGFLGLRRTNDVLKIVEWWERQLIDKCVINLPEGLFVDQKWADLFPAFIKRTSILHHPGYNVAYWNLSQRTIKLIDSEWYSNGELLRFVHFSGNNLKDPYFLSRHSGVLTRDNIGDLDYLLQSYRERLFTNGHAEYSKIPYTFNWGGTNGINIHTPTPYNPDGSHQDEMQMKYEQRDTKNPVARLRSGWKVLYAAYIMAGGWLPLLLKTFRAFRQGGITAIRQRAHTANNYAEAVTKVPHSKPAHKSEAEILDWVSRILIIDSSTPKPDRDAGSLSTFNLLKIYLDLGYDVTFIPSDLLYFGDYTESLRELGVRCLQRPEINSVKEHLQKEGSEYDFVVLCRAPIAALYIADIRRYASSAKILFDTIDLHYLREEREANLDGSQEKIRAAENAKQWELDIIRQCDVTIVLSSVEIEILKKEADDADIRLIPLIFVENVYEIPSFDERRDFLFIGGFPHTPNVDAVLYFCDEILPLIRKRLPDIKFHIIGNEPPTQVLELANHDGVIVHGYMKDVTPMFRMCRLSVAPLRYGAGIKGKIATSLANGVPVIATKLAVEGMEIEVGKHVLVADDPQQFADSFIHAYESKDLWSHLSENGRHQSLRVYSAVAGHRRISKLMEDVNPRHKQIDLYTVRSFQEYDLLRQTISEEINKRKSIELGLIRHNQPNFFTDGFCAICGHESKFNTSFMYSYETTDDGKMIPNWREHLDCIQCGLTNRLRAAMHIFYQRIRPLSNASIYITEQTTSLFKWLKKRHSKMVGSEYFGDAVPFGAEKGGLRNEDLTALTFPNNSFDYILSFDVMEHVSDDIAALKEVYRCLKPGGTFMFTAPFAKERTEKLVRARMRPDDSIEHIMPPEYHGNPVDQENGSLCFRYFAWDLIDDMKKIGFEDPKVLNYWSRDFAYLGVEQFLFIGTKRNTAS